MFSLLLKDLISDFYLVSLLHSLYYYDTMPQSLFLKLFDVKVLPMLLYGAEVWGARQYECIERIHYYLRKRFLNTSLNASNYAVTGECGRCPLYIENQKQVVKYWLKIIHKPDHKYVKLCYKMLFHFDYFGRTNWAFSIKNILFKYGFGYVS